MTQEHRFTFAEAGPSEITAEVGGRFIAASQHEDPGINPELVAPGPDTALARDGAPSAAGQTTSEVIRRFNEAFERHDAASLSELVAEDCIIENSTPAPRGSRHVGRKACLELWSRLATSPELQFEVEEVLLASERAIIRWQLRWGKGENDWVRGVNVMRVRDGLIVEALGYSKGK